jgi:hypothetical protein
MGAYPSAYPLREAIRDQRMDNGLTDKRAFIRLSVTYPLISGIHGDSYRRDAGAGQGRRFLEQ